MDERLGFVSPDDSYDEQDGLVSGLPGTLVNGEHCRKVGYVANE